MPNFRTSSLFHYTSINSLKRLLKEGIKPNFCKEDFSPEGSEFIVAIPMVSFCDIPLTRTYEFTSRYGNHAIGLSKEWAKKNKINPILYINNEDIISSLQLELYSQKTSLNLLGYAKKYTGLNPKKNVMQCNYEENEWRYIIKEDEGSGIKWKWSHDEYKLWRGKGTKPVPEEAFEQRKLKFEVDDITHIIVEFERQIPDFIKSIEQMDKIGGYDTKLTENQKKIIYSKIISMEKIKNDF